MVVDANAAPPSFKVEKRDGDVVLEHRAAHRARFADEWRRAIHGPQRQDRCSPKTPARVLRARRFAALQSRAPTRPSTVSGQHQNAQMNLNGEDVELAQHNMDIGVPFVVSSAQLRRALGQQLASRASAIRSPMAWRRAISKIRDAAGKEGGFTARYSIDGTAEARARREGHQLPVHPRPLQLAEGIADAARSRRPARRPTSCPTRR